MHRILLLAALSACALAKPPPPAPPRHTELGLHIKGVTLANGLRVVLVRDPHANEVQVTMRYRVGAGDDLEHPGIAHLVEHLMFQQVLGSQTLFAHLEDNATFFNAFTSFDSTTYISRARPDFLDKLLSIEAVRLGFRCTSITDSAFEREREVVVQEHKGRDEAIELRTAIHAAVFPDGHPYRGSGGTPESIAAITRAEACAFADSYYATSNAALVISGNLSNEQVEAALGKFLARVGKRVAASPAPVPIASKFPPRDVSIPIDEEALLVTWPLPQDPGNQLTVRVLANLAASAIDSEIKGRALAFELGDVRAPVIAIVVDPEDGETVEDVRASVEEVMNDLPTVLSSPLLSSELFDSIRQRMVYAKFAALEDGSDRDTDLATHVLAGRDPGEALSTEFRALRSLGRVESSTAARRYLDYADASIVRIKPNAKKRGRKLDVRVATHDMGQRRSVIDPVRAREPDTSVAIPKLAPVTRVLPNGLKVVLLPLSSVPTVDMRLVFGAGTADEPAAKRGAALIAAYALTFDLHHYNDAYAFAVSGGSMEADVTADRTSFVVKGVDMYLDYLLAGLRRWAVDGRYGEGADALVDALQRVRKRTNDGDTIADAWTEALYGAQHPYAHAGDVRHAASNVTVEDAEAFRAAYFKPDNATLVIAGHFDVALANQWIDYLFNDWTGKAKPRASPPPVPAAASLAKIEALDNLLVLFALPAPDATHAQRLVVAAMLDDIARDVRHQLGASYAFNAALVENRLSSTFVIGGWVEPTRANDVVQLLRDRVAKLQADPDAAARAFVIARARVVASLASLTGSASLLAARAETDIELGRTPLSDFQTAHEVETLTVDQLTPVIAKLDLSRAAVAMRGAKEPVSGAFALLGRNPKTMQVDQVKEDTAEDPTTEKRPTKSHKQHVYLSELDYAITSQGPATKPALEINGAVTVATSGIGDLVPPGASETVDNGPSGVIVVGEAGLRFRNRVSSGLYSSFGGLTATYPVKLQGFEVDRKSYSIVPIEIGAYLHAQPTDNFWGGLLAGVSFAGVRFDGDRSWSAGLQVGLEAGYDLTHWGDHWLAIFARASGDFVSDLGLGAVGIGLAYRH